MYRSLNDFKLDPHPWSCAIEDLDKARVASLSPIGWEGIDDSRDYSFGCRGAYWDDHLRYFAPRSEFNQNEARYDRQPPLLACIDEAGPLNELF